MLLLISQLTKYCLLCLMSLQVEELTLRLILDPEAEVVESAFSGLLPGFLAWAKAGDKLMAKLLPSVLARALTTVQVRRKRWRDPEFWFSREKSAAAAVCRSSEDGLRYCVFARSARLLPTELLRMRSILADRN